MTKTLYLECNTGISGDMTVAALLDLGANWQYLKSVLESMPVSGYEVECSRVKKAGIDCMDFQVRLEHENHDHDMQYLYGHEHSEHHHQVHLQEHNHQAHPQEKGHHHHHEHRGLPEILELLEQCQMTDGARATAKKIFYILAEAEAGVHAVPMEQVHFHEVGAVDSIVDIVAAAVCLDNLGIEEVIVPRLCEGMGSVRCQHGILPVPVPATAAILEKHQIRLKIIEEQGEFVTPTGAAIVAAIRTSDRLPEEWMIQKIGLGAGKRNYERASILRAMLIK